jgi:hypothetical protein
MKTSMAMWNVGLREIILEALEDRIVLDAAVDHTLADVAAHATEAAAADATGGVAAHATDAAGVNPTGYWAWEHNAWCYHDTASMWWWWPDSSSPQGGNWLYQGTGWTGMWNYDWNDGWEWFYNAFYNNRYFHEGDLYWGQDGSHNWYYTSTFGTNFSTWNSLGSLVEGVVYADFESGHGNAVECLNGGSWVHNGDIMFQDTEYSATGWHSVSQFDPQLYDGVGWHAEPVTLSWTYNSSDDSFTCHVYGLWTGQNLLNYRIEDPSSSSLQPGQGPYSANNDTGGPDPNSGDIDLIFEFNNDPNFLYQQGLIATDWRVIYYNQASSSFGMSSLVYDTQLISYAEHSLINDWALDGHGAPNDLWIGSDDISNSNVASYASAWSEIGECLTPYWSDVQFHHCSIAGSTAGQAMISAIANYTGVYAYASTDTSYITQLGHSCGGGDMCLEYVAPPDAAGGIGDFENYTDGPWNYSLCNMSCYNV